MIKNNRIFKSLTIFNIITLFALALLAFAVALMPTINKFGLFQPVIPIFFGAIVLNIAIIFVANTNFSRKVPKWFLVFGIIVIFALILGIQLLYAHALLSSGYTWDSNTIYQAAVAYSTSGRLGSDIQGYLVVNSNNIPLFLILSRLFIILNSLGYTDLLWGAVLLNVVISFFTQILIYLVCKMLFGRRTALCSIPFSFVLVGLNLHIQTPYTDTLAVLFPILIFFLILQFIKARKLIIRLILAFLLGITSAVGTLIKPTVIIAMIAGLLIGLVWLLNQRKKVVTRKFIQPIVLSIGMFAAAAIGTYAGYVAIVNSQNILPYSYSHVGEQTLPPQHFINMGMMSHVEGYSVYYGGYNGDTATIVAKLPSRDARVAYSVDSIRTQLSNYGMVGYMQFLGHKLMWISSDATFFAFGEGDNANVKFMDNSHVSTLLRKFTYIEGPYYQITGNIMQVFWVALLLMIALQLMISILWRPASISPFLTMLHLMIIGIIVFLLIFEGRSRYLFLYVPIFIVTGMYTLNWFRIIAKEDSRQSIISKGNDDGTVRV